MTRTSLFQNINEACFFNHYFLVIFFINNQRTPISSYEVASCYTKKGVRSGSCVFESVSYTYIKPAIICLAFLVTFCLFYQDARPEWFLVSHMILDRNLKDSLRCSRLISWGDQDYNLPEPGYHSIEGHPLAFRQAFLKVRLYPSVNPGVERHFANDVFPKITGQ